MRLFNKKEIESLQPFEIHFETILKAKYKRMTTTKVNDLVADVYEEATNEAVTRNWSCANCIYTLFEKVGKLYYKSIEALPKDEPKTRKSTTRGRKPNKSKK